MTTPDYNLDVALALVRAGLPVFPCDQSTEKPRSKRPLVDSWPERATTAPNGVRYYWSTRPGAIVGVQLGKSGLVVIDLDVGHADGKDGVAEFEAILDHYGGSLDGVPVVRTWSGGYHCYYRQPMGREPLGNREGMLADTGINVRGAGGYVIAPGSVMATGEYYECCAGWPDLCEAFVAGTIPEIPGWLVELIEWKPPESERVPSSQSEPTAVDTDRARKWALGALDKISVTLTGAAKGSRNCALNDAVYTLAGKAWCGLSEREVYDAMLWACRINKMIQDDGSIDPFNATFRSGWDSGILKPLPGPKERYPADIEIGLE
jgi:hypothetical protein